MGSFSYSSKYPSAIKYNNTAVNYLKYNGNMVWIRPSLNLVNMTSSANLTYSVPISATYRIVLVGGGGKQNGTNGGGGSGGYCYFDKYLTKGTSINFHCGGAGDKSYATVSGATHYAYAGGDGYGYWGGYMNRTWIHGGGAGGTHTDNGSNGNAGTSSGGNGASVYGGYGAGGGGTGLCRMWIVGG